MDGPLPPEARSHTGMPRILLLALLPIGDTLFITPTLRAVRACYPSAHLTALVHASAAPLMRRVPAVDETVVLPFRADFRGLVSLARVLAQLRRQRFDVAVDFTTPAFKWVSFASGIRVRTYMKFDPCWWFIPTEHRRWRTTHATRHYYDCARELELPPWSEVSHVPELVLAARERAEASAWALRNGLEPRQRPIVVLHVGGTGLDGLKRWPAERFAAVADALAARWHARIVLVGGPDERTLAEHVAAMTRHRPAIAAGQLSLLGTAALIALSDVLVGNDSGPLHLAAAVGTPFVAIFGPTSLANFHPIPREPRQGRFALPPWPCGLPRYFVGGAPIWSRPCCQGTCAALLAVDAATVVGHVDALLADRFPSPVASV